MEVKGTAIAPMNEYVLVNHKPRYEDWLNELSPQSRNIIKNPLAGTWYPLEPGILEPTRKACAFFHRGNERGAWEIGRFSADRALQGVYKMFVKFGSPSFIVGRGSRIIANYYRPCEINITEKADNGVVLHVWFAKPERLVQLRIGGWIERAIELSGKKCDVKLSPVQVAGRTVTEYTVTWR